MQKVREFFHNFDMFTAMPTLRAKSEPEVANSFGGILSIIVLLLFSYLFIAQLAQVTNWEKISSIQTQTNDLQGKSKISNFPVAIGIQGFPLSHLSPYVRFQFLQLTLKGTEYMGHKVLKQQPCQVSHFSDLGDNAESSFKNFDLKQKMCLSPGQNFTITQINVGDIFTMLAVQVNNCRRLNADGSMIYQGCQSQQNMTISNQAWIRFNKYFTVMIYYINTAFNPTNKVATTKFMDVIRLTFTLNRGSQAFIYLSPYVINTDTSILPYSAYESQQGYKFDYSTQSNFQAIPYFENVNVFFSVSQKSIQVDRSIGKIDEVLSYAGGLFGIIISLLSFFIINFNQYRYELMVGQGAFNYSEQGHKMNEHEFNFIQFVKYSLYSWIKVLTCHEMKWKNCKQIDETRQQANNQLDVRLLFRKIQHFEKVIEYLISDKQNTAIYLTQPPSLDQVKKKRRIAQYYDKVIKGQAAVTVQDISNVKNVYNFAMGLSENATPYQNDNSNPIQISNINPSIGSNPNIGNSANQSIQSMSVIKLSKRRLNQQPLKQRQNILQHVFENYKDDIDIDDVELDSDEEILENQIAEAFFKMQKKAKRRIQEKIPIKILYRLRRKYLNQISKQGISLNLEI